MQNVVGIVRCDSLSELNASDLAPVTKAATPRENTTPSTFISDLDAKRQFATGVAVATAIVELSEHFIAKVQLLARDARLFRYNAESHELRRSSRLILRLAKFRNGMQLPDRRFAIHRFEDQA